MASDRLQMSEIFQEENIRIFSLRSSQLRELRLAETTRKHHICRLYDLLQLCIAHGDVQRASGAWSILSRCKELDWISMWRLGLLITSKTASSENSMQQSRDVEFLKRIMSHSKSASDVRPFLLVYHYWNSDQKQAILKELIMRLARQGKYKDALDQLEL